MMMSSENEKRVFKACFSQARRQFTYLAIICFLALLLYSNSSNRHTNVYFADVCIKPMSMLGSESGSRVGRTEPRLFARLSPTLGTRNCLRISRPRRLLVGSYGRGLGAIKPQRALALNRRPVLGFLRSAARGFGLRRVARVLHEVCRSNLHTPAL